MSKARTIEQHVVSLPDTPAKEAAEKTSGSPVDSLTSNLVADDLRVMRIPETDSLGVTRYVDWMPVQPYFRLQHENRRLRAALSILTVGGVVASPHNRRISLSFETDEQYQQAEQTLDIADKEQPVETKGS